MLQHTKYAAKFCARQQFVIYILLFFDIIHNRLYEQSALGSFGKSFKVTVAHNDLSAVLFILIKQGKIMVSFKVVDSTDDDIFALGIVVKYFRT